MDSDGEIVHRFFKIEGGGELVEERSTAAVEKVCFQTQSDNGPECRTRLRIAGPLIRNSLPIEENFDAQVAVSNLIQRGIPPNELSTSRLTEGELFGLPSAVETLQQSLRFGVLDETTCPQLTTHLNKLLEDTALLVRSQPTEEDAWEIPWPHTAWVTYQVTTIQNEEPTVLSMSGYNNNPVMQATRAFRAGVAPCLDQVMENTAD